MAFRRANVFAVNPETQEATIVQVVRTSDAGGVTPYAREFDAMSDILGSTRYQDLINQGYTVNAYMVRRAQLRWARAYYGPSSRRALISVSLWS